MDMSTIDDTAHRAAAAARPVAEAVAEVLTEAASVAASGMASGVESVLNATPGAVSATTAMTAGAASVALRFARQHPYVVLAGATVVAAGMYAAWRRRSAQTATPSAVRLSDVRAAA
jgi:hypothetical protein